MHRSLQHCSLVRGANYIAERIDQKAKAEHLTEAITATYAINVDLQSISLRRKWSFRQAYLTYVGPRVQVATPPCTTASNYAGLVTKPSTASCPTIQTLMGLDNDASCRAEWSKNAVCARQPSNPIRPVVDTNIPDSACMRAPTNSTKEE